MAKFSVGEIAIGQNHTRSLECNGMECEIIGGLSLRKAINLHTLEKERKLFYRVAWADGMITCTSEHNLRKKKPPKEIDWVKLCKLDKVKEIA